MKNIINQNSNVSPKSSNNNISEKDKKHSSLSENYIIEKFKNNNILIAVRVRPLNSSEKEDSDYKTIKVITENKLIISIPTEYSFEKKSKINHIHVIKEKQSIYEYDFILDEDSSQSKVYQYTTYELLYQIIDGYNATIFTYGATGTGKTYTMVGEGSNVGIMIQSLRDLFLLVNNCLSKDKKFIIKISYIEIYNEIIKDLLSSNNSIVELRSDAKKGLILKNAIIKKVSNEIEAFNLIIKGNKNRTEKNTEYNNNSSRSHAILNVYIEIEEKEVNLKQKKSFGKFMLLDLAGCEKTSFNNNSKNKELGSINKSLLALNKCISLLISKNRGFIPWRDSNLTRLLQESLSGNGKIVMIATISMALTCFDETMFTLQFASRARNIKSNMKKNIEIKDKGINKYEEFIKDIKEEIHEVKNDIIKQDKLIENKNKNLDVSNLETNNDEKEDKDDKEINEDKEQNINDNENKENKEIEEENKYEKIYKDMMEHFQLEIKLKKKIIEKENNIEELKNDMAEKEYEILHTNKVNLAPLQKQLKEKQEEIEDKSNKIIKGYIKQSELMNKRKEFQKVISFLSNNTPNTPEFYKIYHNYKYNINLLDKMTIEHKRNIQNHELKRKDRKIEGLMEQMLLRDKFIIGACEKFEQKKIDFNYKNPDFIKSKDLKNLSFYPKTFKVPSTKKIFKDSYLKKKSISSNDQINDSEIKMNNKEINSENKIILKQIDLKNNRNYKLSNRLSEAQNHSLLIKKRIKNDLFSDLSIKKSELNINSMINDLQHKRKISQVKKPLNALKLKSKSIGKIKNLINKGYQSEKIIDNKKIKLGNEEMNDSNNNQNKSIYENLETVIQKKIKTIIRKNYIIRYKNSPYLKILDT